MAISPLFLAIAILVFASFAYASDPNPLQDFCIAVPDSSAAVFVNGKICKNPQLATPDDFSASGLNIPANTNNTLGSGINVIDVNKLPGLNTLGLSVVRADFAPFGLNAPHSHPRASELLFVLEGTLYVGFVTSNPPPNSNMKNRFFTKVLNPGDVFVFPQGLVHFEYNIGKTNAVAFALFNSQTPATVTVADAVFGSNPPISNDVLSKAFRLDKKVINYLQSQNWNN